MQIAADSFTIKLSYDELWLVAWSMRKSILVKAQEYFDHNKDKQGNLHNFNEIHSTDLYILKNMYLNLGRPELFLDVESAVSSIIQPVF